MIQVPLSWLILMASLTNGDRILFKFEDPAGLREWQTVNDNVMGGVSDGRFEITGDRTLRFFGQVSLENNGGFASIRSVPKEQDLSKYDGILIRVKGDGKKYAFNIRTDFEIMAGSYRRGFDTGKGVWQQIFLPFDSFQATTFGQLLQDAPRLNARKMRSLGLAISDKQAGPFQLHVDWIKAAIPPTDLEELLVTAGCATCIFKMAGVQGCKLAVDIEAKRYLVTGSDIDGHGNAHADNGLCNAARKAVVSGRIKDDRIVVTVFKLLPN